MYATVTSRSSLHSVFGAGCTAGALAAVAQGRNEEMTGLRMLGCGGCREVFVLAESVCMRIRDFRDCETRMRTTVDTSARSDVCGSHGTFVRPRGWISVAGLHLDDEEGVKQLNMSQSILTNTT